jgi:hypothetical protein
MRSRPCSPSARTEILPWGEQWRDRAKSGAIVTRDRKCSRTRAWPSPEAAAQAPLEVVVDEIGPSLRWAVALPTKVTAKRRKPAMADEPPF